MSRTLLVACVLGACASLSCAWADELVPRWKIASDGGISWEVAAGDAHQDFVEMNGEQVGLVIRYGINKQGTFTINHELVWPMLRFHPNLTQSHLRISFGEDARIDEDHRFSAGLLPSIYILVGDRWWPLAGRMLKRVHLKGIAQFDGILFSDGPPEAPQLSFQRRIFPSLDKPLAIDTTEVSNTSDHDVELSVDKFQQTFETNPERGIYGAYTVMERVLNAGTRVVHPGESTTITVVFEAHKAGEPFLELDVAAEASEREHRMEEVLGELRLETPDPVLNTAFAFAKWHTTESLFRTKGGLLHSPGGGGSYYAAIWANDQAEYANPFFGMLGDRLATQAAINSFQLFARFMNTQYQQIPSSIISEGEGFWNGAGDRGDMAMIAYGAARFALANGDRKTAEKLWSLIEWCLEYLKRKVTVQGVVASDSDELEGRLPAGKANLNTSCLYYDALQSAVKLGGALGKPKAQLDGYFERAVAVKSAIGHYFGAEVGGFATYRYYDKADLVGNSNPQLAAYATRPDLLRDWIATPLAMGIFDRKVGTVDALFSPRLWTSDGVVSQEGQPTYWDRATLYALRGVLAAGATEQGMEHLKSYSNRRLLGEHVPYPYEADPEGGKAQLAAESALYCRVFTEGLFGIRPTGLHDFAVTPRLPDGWPSMALTDVRAFGGVFDLWVHRISGGGLRVEVLPHYHPIRTYLIKAGDTVEVTIE